MTQLPQTPQNSQVIARKRNADSPWLWLSLLLGSAVIHTVLAVAAIPLWQRLSSPPVERVASVPIELVDLPPEVSESATQLAAPAHSNSSSSNITAAKPVPQATAAPPTPKISRSMMPETRSPVPSSSQQGEGTDGSELSTSDTEATGSTGIVQPSPANEATSGEAGDPTGQSSQTSGTSEPETPETPETPEFATIPIDRPPPDVSQTLPINPNPIPSPTAQVEVNRETTPINLTVSLDFERIPIEQAGDNPDRLATPADEVTSREISTVAESACAGVLKPEIMQSLGIKVALQVSTDVTGQVTQASTQVTSRNSAYDELARCLVQHWGFIPAEDEGEPIPSNALRVWVTIDRI